MPDKMTDASRAAPKKNLREDGVAEFQGRPRTASKI